MVTSNKPQNPPLRFKNKSGENYPNWQTKKLGEIGNIFSGLTSKSKNDFIDNVNSFYIPYLNISNNIVCDTNNLPTVNIKEYESQTKLQKNDILITITSETKQDIGLCSIILSEIENTYLNSFSVVFRINNPLTYYSLFFAYLLRSNILRGIITSLGQGNIRVNLSKLNLITIPIPLPSFYKSKQR